MTLASAAAANASLNGLDGTGTTNLMGFASLHTATPGTTGASEYSGVTRQAATWAAAASSSKATSAGMTFTTSGATAVTHMGTWTLVTAGAYTIGAPLGSSVTAASITVASGALAFTSS